MTKRVFLVLSILLIAHAALAQVARPKGKHKRLDRRYKDLSCALVLIQAGREMGTGFYTNANGDVVTALHVLGQKIIYALPNGSFNIQLMHVKTFEIRDDKGEYSVSADALDSSNGDAWGADLAVLRTKRETGCWLRIGDDESALPGQHIIVMGFPGLAFGSLSMYSGIISARLKNNLVAGTTVTGQPISQTNEFLRVQAPISPGISGAPVINDRNEAIAVVTEAGAWSADLDFLTQLQRTRDAAAQAQPGTPFDALAALAHLAEIFHDFASPGYGDSVPLSYLERRTPTSGQQPSPNGR